MEGYVLLHDGLYPTENQMDRLINNPPFGSSAEFFVVYFKSKDDLLRYISIKYPGWKKEYAVKFGWNINHEEVPGWYNPPRPHRKGLSCLIAWLD